MEKEKLNEFLYELHETEKGGVLIYQAAVKCVQNEDLKEEWEKYLEETKNHVEQTKRFWRVLIWILRRTRQEDKFCGTLHTRW